MPDQIPLFRGHTATVLDTDWYADPRDAATRAHHLPTTASARDNHTDDHVLGTPSTTA